MKRHLSTDRTDSSRHRDTSHPANGSQQSSRSSAHPDQVLAPATTVGLTIPPSGEFGPLGLTDPYHLTATGVSRKSNRIGRVPGRSITKQALAGVDRLESSVEWHKVPLAALVTDHPQSTHGSVECDATPYRQRLEYEIVAERLVAVKAGGVQAS